MIRSAVAMSALPPLQSAYSLEEFHGSERLGRPRAEAIQRELRLLAGFYVHEDVVVLLFGRLALPIKIRRVIRWYLDARTAGENRVLFGAATAQHQVFHAVDFVHLGGV